MALVRVKRRAGEEPAEALLVACKRIRMIDDDSGNSSKSEDLSSIFTFAGTFDNKDKLESPQVVQVLKEAHQKNPKARIVNVLDRARKESQSVRESNRFKIVNRYRAQLANEEIKLDTDEKSGDLSLCVYDVEDESELKEDDDLKNAPFLQEYAQSAISCNGMELIRQNNTSTPHSYVYDYYYTSEFDEDGVLDHTFCIEKYFDPDTLNYRDDASEHFPSDDEDSNEENYYKNDYPEERDEESGSEGNASGYDEYGMCDLMSSTHLHKLESSDEEEDYDYNDPKPAKEDILYHGVHYARFKAKILKDLEDGSDKSGESDESDESAEIVE